MDIRIQQGEYKSLEAGFEWLDIPPFAVITGPNGSGKTHLLEFIALMSGMSFVPEGALRMMVDPIGPAKKPARAELTPTVEPRDALFLRSMWPAAVGAVELQQVINIANEAWQDKETGFPHWTRLWDIVCEQVGKDRNAISEREFLDALPPNFPLLSDKTHERVEATGITSLFVSYLYSMDLLRRRGRTMEEMRAELSPLPWDVLNDVLTRAGLSYRVKEPTLPDYQRFKQENIAYKLALDDKQTHKQIDPTQLSAGEKVMFQVALWFFSFAERRGRNLAGDSRRLLLLDEPDAHLHPELTKAFLDVIRYELVDKHGVRVIMTTHSPSTVALAPESSIYVMRRQAPRIAPAKSIWEALGQLTAGFLAIGTDSKCVFVEGKPDREFYTTLQTMLARPRAGPSILDTARSMLFIDAGAGHPGEGKGSPSGGKENVKKWVRAIESTQIAGIIDLDGGTTPEPRVHVLGRHSLENYLLDPLFLSAILLENKKAPSIPGVTLGIHDARQLLDKGAPTLQALTDEMTNVMRSLLASPPVSTERRSVKYLKGPELMLERWLIESSLKQLLQPLKDRYALPFDHAFLTKQYELMEIMPSELADIMKAIQAS